MTVQFSIKRGDILPKVRANLYDETGAAIDLTTAVSVRFHWRLKNGGPGKSGACTILNALTGDVEYGWVAGDTNVAGVYQGEFRVEFSGGKLTVPSYGYLEFEIQNSL